MIQFSLKCANDHRFDSWFQSGSAFEKLHASGMVNCVICGSNDVSKAMVAPRVSTAEGPKTPEPPKLSAPASPAEQALAELRKYVEKNSDYVGQNFATEAREHGIRVMIAAAGMAAHLAGALAARTALPVIGVPLQASSGPVGLDALLSTVQMPPGVPVACMAVGKAGARNAAIFAVQILALSDETLAQRLDAFRKAQAQSVVEKDQALNF